MGFLPKRPYYRAFVDSWGFGFNILVHRLTQNARMASNENKMSDGGRRRALLSLHPS
jgi:hypothetical protein